ncbi:alpha-mannosidase [Coprobacter sp.]
MRNLLSTCKRAISLFRKKWTLAICLTSIAGSLSATQPDKPYKAYVVSNAHFDTQWLWTVRTSIIDYIPRTIYQNLALIQNYPDYIFNFEGAIKYNWMKEYYPLDYERVKDAIKAGRWHVSGSSWDANDVNVPSPESGFRNILLGQEFYKKEFGLKSTDIFLPDCFGFSYTLPSIAAHCGLIGFSTQKLGWRKNPFYGDSKIPFTIGRWKGIDGAELICAFDCGSYVYNFKENDLTKDRDLMQRVKRDPMHTAYRYFGAGDRGGSAMPVSTTAIEKALTSGNGPIEIISASSDQLYKDYLHSGKVKELPIFDGELLMDVHASGCYTSQSAMKRFNRRNEQLADAAERASVIAEWLGALPYQKKTLTESWQRFIWHQFHDDLTGTSIKEAYPFSWNDEILSQTQFMQVMNAASGAVISGMNTKAGGTPVVVYNPAAYARRNIAEAFIPTDKAPSGIKVYSPDGKETPAQLLGYSDGKAHILFVANVDPVSYSVYDIRLSGKQKKKQALAVTTNSIENNIYKVTVNADGDISSIIDKRVGKELVKNGKAIRLALFRNNISNEWPAWEIIKNVMDAEPETAKENVKITIEENGNLRSVLKIERKDGDSRFIQRICLTEGAADDRIDIITDIDWATKATLLKAEFPLSVSNKEASYDLGLGNIKRGNNTDLAYEVYAQHWADLSDKDGSYGVSILNNCKYGWDKPDDNTLRLTLLHTPGSEKRYLHQRTMDFGHHQIIYSIVGHSQPLENAGIVQKAEELNQPLISYIVPKHNGTLGKTISFVNSNTPQIAIKMLKKAEAGNGYVLRIYETAGKEVEDAKITFPATIEWAREVNGIEENIGNVPVSGNTIFVSCGKFQPKTYIVKLKDPQTKLKPAESKSIALNYNANGISTDYFAEIADVDGHKCSYAAELLPSVLEVNGIPFTIGKAGMNNIIKCKGDTINIPQDKTYNKIYILAASMDKDRTATFRIGNQAIDLKVPYYSDFYAQWGLQDFSEGYVKEGVIAHVGTHRHRQILGLEGSNQYVFRNEPYQFTYIYRLALDIPKGVSQVVLPDNKNIVVFAVTASVDNNNVQPAIEPRVLPLQTKTIEYAKN